MLIVCPNCKNRFNIDPAIAQDAKKLRCSSCRAVFGLVRKVPREQAAPAALPAKLKVVIANESVPFCEAVQKVLSSEPFELFICNDGKEALETVQRIRPELLLLDVALPTMFGFEVCERVRQDPALAGVKIVLIASIYDKTRYKRSPNSLYGADDYIEKHHIPDSLIPMIYRLASGSVPDIAAPSAQELAAQEDSRTEIRQVEVRETCVGSAPLSEAVASPSPAPTLTAPTSAAPTSAAPTSAAPTSAAPIAAAPIAAHSIAAQPVAAPVAAAPIPVAPIAAAPGEQKPVSAAPVELPEVEVKARRLARIIVSDIVLYNQGKVEQGLRNGTFYQLLADDIREGDNLYRQRVSQEVRDRTSFLKDAFEDLIAKKRAELRI
jgi:predicted Zn finger-like uncharacterized protein